MNKLIGLYAHMKIARAKVDSQARHLKARREIAFSMIMINKTILKYWKRKMKARGGDICQVTRGRIRHSLSFLGQSSFQEDKAKNLLQNFLCLTLGRELLIKKGGEFYKSIVSI